MTRKTVCMLFLMSFVVLASEAFAQYPYAVPVRPRVASKMVAMDKAAPTAKAEETKAVTPKAEETKVQEAKAAAPSAQPVQKTAQATRPVTPTKAHTGYTRSEIRSMPILERPSRPGHFYGNTVRRRAGVYNN